MVRFTHPHSSDIEPAILRLAAARGPEKSICPSEVARALAEDWRPLMPLIKTAALRLAARDEVRLLRHGRIIDAGIPLKGIYRIAIAR